jgi:GDP-mannose transporter
VFYIVLFVLGIYTNMQALAYSNVDTVIVFRSCSPLAVSFLDWAFMGRELPSTRSALALLALLAGVYGYVVSDKDFAMQGIMAYTWVTAYFLIIAISMTYGKWLISALEFKDRIWGSVYYTNVLSVIPMVSIGMINGDFDKLNTIAFTRESLIYLLLSSAIGIGISYSGFYSRNVISATSFSLVGVVNKLATILLNVMIWDDHASVEGLVFLCLCIFASSFYQESGLRPEWVHEQQKPKKALEEVAEIELS